MCRFKTTLLVALAAAACAAPANAHYWRPESIPGYELIGELDTRPGYDLYAEPACNSTLFDCVDWCNENNTCGGFTFWEIATTIDAGDQNCCVLKSAIVQPLAYFPSDDYAGFTYTKLYPQLNNTNSVPVELLGTWLGNEVFDLTPGPSNYSDYQALCTRLIQQPSYAPGGAQLDWVSNDGFCANNSITPALGTITDTNYSWFKNIMLDEIYNQQVIGWQCMADDYCQDDLGDVGPPGTTNHHQNVTVLAKSCGQYWTKDVGRAPDLYYCNAYQVMLVNEPLEDKNYTIATIAYGETAFTPGYDSDYYCPSMVTFDWELINADNTTAGTTRMTRQNTYTYYDNSGERYDWMMWDCLVNNTFV